MRDCNSDFIIEHDDNQFGDEPIFVHKKYRDNAIFLNVIPFRFCCIILKKTSHFSAGGFFVILSYDISSIRSRFRRLDMHYMNA